MKENDLKRVLREYLKQNKHFKDADHVHKPPEPKKDSWFQFPSLIQLGVAVASVAGISIQHNGVGPAGAVDTSMTVNGFLFQDYQPAANPLDELNVPPDYHLDEVARRVGRQLNRMVAEFDANPINAVNFQARAEGIREWRFHTRYISLSDIVARIRDNMTPNTFRVALEGVRNSFDSIPEELALGAEFVRLTMPHAPFRTLANVFCECFSNLPELEDMADLF